MGPEAAGWLDYRTARATPDSTVVGDLRVLPGLASPEFGSARDILVHMPAGALTSGRRYPVLYLHDGQDLFDAVTSFVGESQVDTAWAARLPDALRFLYMPLRD